ncbi:MAG: hypothetical protein RBU30_08240 [Polyangia bacterium]|nr:hypothetical protein [Polyangia bacterium]
MKLRTKFALRALELSKVWQAAFAETTLGGSSPRRAILSVPEGQSTAGGAQAHQSISLVPEDPAKGILVAGSVDGAGFTAELRGFAYLNETHRLRFGRPMDLPASTYQEFLLAAKNLLESNGFTVTVVNQLPEAAKRRYQESKPADASSSLKVVLAFLALAAAAAVMFLLLKG